MRRAHIRRIGGSKGVAVLLSSARTSGRRHACPIALHAAAPDPAEVAWPAAGPRSLNRGIVPLRPPHSHSHASPNRSLIIVVVGLPAGPFLVPPDGFRVPLTVIDESLQL